MAFIQPLVQVETLAGLKKGVWTYHHRLVKTRQLNLGKPHIRKGEKANVVLIEAVMKVLGINQEGALTALPEENQRALLKACIQALQDQKIASDKLGGEAEALFVIYQNMMFLDSHSTLIQSDSAETLSSVAASILLIKAVSLCIGHRGKCVILCENELSMKGAIALMQSSQSSHLFKDIIMMCAGSDNQKKCGPFYSAFLNRSFLKVA